MTEVLLRPEAGGDLQTIHDVVKSAFDNRQAEPDLVDLIRRRGNARLATVAVEPADPGRLVGYILASPMTLDPPAALRCLGIAPVAVVPDRQNAGIGSKLVRHVIALARAANVDALFLLGSPRYYPRFGFRATHIGNEYRATDAFMALELTDGCLAGVTGTARYVGEFAEVGA